jgi:tetratricopeptide (TPR) repeat protein
MGGILADASKLTETIEFLEGALTRSDRPEDEPYRADMLARLSRAHMRLGAADEAVARADEALAIAEPRRLRRIVAEAFVNKAAALASLQRIREPVVLMSAAVELAHDLGDVALELRARNNLAAVQGNEDGDAALQAAREAYELATRLGVPQMAAWIAGAIGWGAIYEGLDWDAAIAMLERQIPESNAMSDRGRLMAVREHIIAWRGQEDPESAAERRQLTATVSDPDVSFWDQIGPAVLALVEGRYEEAERRFRESIRRPSQNSTDGRMGLILAAHLARDPAAAQEAIEAMEQEPYAGHYADGMRALAQAGLAALQGRDEEALEAYRLSLDELGHSGARFQVALVQLDALSLLPDEPAIAGWANEARARFEVLSSPPLLERLEEALAAREQQRPASVEGTSASRPTSATEPAAS